MGAKHKARAATKACNTPRKREEFTMFNTPSQTGHPQWDGPRAVD
jgi:hypothetical protein